MGDFKVTQNRGDGNFHVDSDTLRQESGRLYSPVQPRTASGQPVDIKDGDTVVQDKNGGIVRVIANQPSANADTVSSVVKQGDKNQGRGS